MLCYKLIIIVKFKKLAHKKTKRRDITNVCETEGKKSLECEITFEN